MQTAYATARLLEKIKRFWQTIGLHARSQTWLLVGGLGFPKSTDFVAENRHGMRLSSRLPSLFKKKVETKS